LLGGRIGNKKVRWAIVMVCIAASTGIAVYSAAIISRNLVTPPKPALKESLQAKYVGYANNIFTVSLSNDGTESILVSQGSCSSGYCFLVAQAALNVGQSNVTVEFSGASPSGVIVFSVDTFNGNTFDWNTSSPAFNPYLGRETLLFDGFSSYAYSPTLYDYFLNLTNTGTANVTIEGGHCSLASCSPVLAPYLPVLHPNVVKSVRFQSSNACPGYITLTFVTALENIFNFYEKAC